MSETKPESTVEPSDRKSPRAEEKAATPIKPTEAIERKGASQVAPEQKGRSAAAPAKTSEARDEIKATKQPPAKETKETKEEKKAKKVELDSKGKSTETQEETEIKQKTLQ